MSFPHVVPSFAGRRAELDRIHAHVDSDVLFFVYGVAGIGKTELVYQLVAELRDRPDWRAATPLLVQVAPGATASHALGQLLSAIGPEPILGEGPLTQLARCLDARPYLLVIDDAHHLPSGFASMTLGYLSRHVQQSRLFVVSRREVVLPPDARSPVVTTLGPLDAVAAGQMTVALADRLGVARPDPERMMAMTRGCPHLIHRLFSHGPSQSGAIDTFDELTPAARQRLRALAAARHPLSLATVQQDDALRELTERFMLSREGERLAVHDLVRDAALGRATPDELAAAHADAADLCIHELATVADPALAAAAAHHAMAAERHEDAWKIVERWHDAIAVAAPEDWLFDTLARLRDVLPERRVTIELLTAQCLLRASRFDDASRVLASIRGADEATCCIVAGELEQDRERTLDLFDRAIACASDPATRFDAQLRRARATFFEAGPRARDQIALALADLPSPTPRQRACASWARAVSWTMDERFEEAAAAARQASADVASPEMDDLANQIAMVETLAAIECNDIESARAAARRIVDTGLRRRVATVYRAIARYADGDGKTASVELVAAHEQFRELGDPLHAVLAGYYGSAALAETGSLSRAQTIAAQTTQLAERAGLHGLAARSLAQQAMFAAEAVQSGLAHSLANAALAHARLGPRSRAVAYCAHARAYTLEGDTALALEHVELAGAALVTPRAAVDIEHAAVDLVGGNLDRAVSYGERVVQQHTGRDYELAHARLVLAAAYIARGRRTDLVLADRTLAEARLLADRGGLRSIQVGCAILSAALARRNNRERAAHEVLASALRDLEPERASIYAGTLLAAIDGGAVARVIPGAVALLGHLGFTETVDCYLVDAHARRAATEKDVARERALRELFVDELRDVIVARRGEAEIRGRPMLCALLSVIVQAGGAPVTPETLYKRAWGVGEYHPLQHRNALYVAINRLRSSLREVLPDRDLIERASAGWRLADGVDACAAVAVRSREKTM